MTPRPAREVVYVGDNNTQHYALVVGDGEGDRKDLAVFENGAFTSKTNVPEKQLVNGAIPDGVDYGDTYH